MSSQAHDRPLTLHPGTSLGPYTLGDTLWRVLETLRARGNERAVAVRWDREDLESPLIVDTPEGVSLVFPQTESPHHQILQLIVLRLGSDDVDGAKSPSSRRTTEVTHNATTLIGSEPHAGLTRGTITQRFGPSFARRGEPSSVSSRTTGRDEQVSYPGMIFTMDAEGDIVRSLAVVARDKEEDPIVRTHITRLRGGEGPWGVWQGPGKGLEGTITHCEIHPGKGITLHFSAGSNPAEPPYVVALGSTTSQDLLADLGPPARRYWKDGAESNVAAASVSGSGECWWNYFELGLDFLVDGASEGNVSKIMVHSNIPGTASFQRHARCPWTLRATKDGRELTLRNTIRDFADAFPAQPSVPTNTRRVTTERRTVRIDRLVEPHMAGVRGIEPSQLLELENMIVEGGPTGITSVLLFRGLGSGLS